MTYNQKVTKIAKLSKTQHAEMTWAYRAFLHNHSYSIRPGANKAAKALKGKGLIASARIGNGIIHTGLTVKGIEYCKYHFAAQIIVML